MAEFIDILSPKALAELKLANEEVLKLVANIDKAGKGISGIGTPSGSDDAVKKLNEDLAKQTKIIADLQKQLQALAQTRQQGNTRSAEEIVNQRILAQNADRLARANSTLAGSYRNLSAQVSIAGERLQNIIARGRLAGQSQREFNRELRNAQREFNALNDRVLAADRAVGRWNRTSERTIALGKDLLSAFGVVGGVTAIAMVGKDIFEQTKQIQSLNMALQNVTGTAENFHNQQVFLSRIAESYGADLNDLTRQFTQFYVSAKDKLAGKEIQDIFESIAKASGALGLSSESRDRAFLALNQMLSKGVVSAEELRGQLGEALPGAFGIFAKSLNVTEQELGKMLKSGTVLAKDVLPAFAKELEKAYGIENLTRVENLAAAQTRLSNSWRSFVASLDNDGNKLSRFFSKILSVTSDIVKGIQYIFESDKQSRTRELEQVKTSAYNEEKEALKGMDEQMKQNAITEREYVREKIVQHKQRAEMAQEQIRLIDAEYRAEGTTAKRGQELIVLRKENVQILTKANNQYAYNIGLLDALNEALNEDTRKTVVNTEAKKKNAKAVKDLSDKKEEQIKIFTERYFETEISKLEDVRKKVADTTLEYASYTNQINVLKMLLEQLRGIDVPDTLRQDQLDALEEGIKKMKSYEESTVKTKEETDALRKSTDEWIESFRSGFFEDAGLPTLLMALKSELVGFGETFTETFLGITQIAQEAFAFIAEASNQNFQNEYNNLAKQKDIALLFAGESATAREEIERQAEQKRLAIAKREFNSKKKQALFNIAIDTAQAIVATLAKTPLPAGLPFVIATGALGAAQAAIVLSQQAPQYWMGTDNHPGGPMIINDRNLGPELVITPDGKGKIYQGKDVMVNAPAGTVVKTATETRDFLMFNDSLNSILTNTGIGVPNIEVKAQNIDLSPVVNAINNKDTVSVSIGKDGLNAYVANGHERKQIMNNRFNFIGKSV